MDNRIGLRQAGLSRKEPESVLHLPPTRRPRVFGTTKTSGLPRPMSAAVLIMPLISLSGGRVVMARIRPSVS